jgi:hypothetical protein
MLLSLSNKAAWYCIKNRHEDKWHRIEDPEINPHSYTHPTFDKREKSTHWRKDSLSKNGSGKSGYPHAED